MRRDTEPTDPNRDPLEAILRGTSDGMAYPPTPRVARRARNRLGRQPSARLPVWRRWIGRLRGDGTESPRAGRSSARWAWSGAAVAVLAVALVGWRLLLPSATEPTVGGTLQAPAAAPAARSEAGRNEIQAQDQRATALTAAAPATPDARQASGLAANAPGSAADQAAAASGGSSGGAAPIPAPPPPAAVPAAPRPAAAPSVPSAAAVPEEPSLAAVPTVASAAAAPPAPATSTGAASRPAPAAPGAGPGPPDSTAPLRRPASAQPLAEATARLGFTPLGPVALGAPAAVVVVDEPTGPRVVLRWDARTSSTAEAIALPPIVLTEEAVRSDADQSSSGEPVVWAGGQGLWQAHAANAGGTLTWSSGGLTFRLESSLSAERAADLAATLAPLLP